MTNNLDTFDFQGIPVIASDLAVERIQTIKRWKRLNRPNKVRIRTLERPATITLEPPASIGNIIIRQTTVVCHPTIFPKLKKVLCNG